jgi:16S rRNA (cytidine1402-2'-O)-methyltransferase
MHEEFRAGTLAELVDYISTTAPRGEFTVVLRGTGSPAAPPDRTDEALERAAALLADGRSRREIVRELTETLGLARNEAYRLVMGLP